MRNRWDRLLMVFTALSSGFLFGVYSTIRELFTLNSAASWLFLFLGVFVLVTAVVDFWGDILAEAIEEQKKITRELEGQKKPPPAGNRGAEKKKKKTTGGRSPGNHPRD